jgi:hypothetical protein
MDRPQQPASNLGEGNTFKNPKRQCSMEEGALDKEPGLPLFDKPIPLCIWYYASPGSFCKVKAV